MTDDWTPVFVLPNIPLQSAIGCDIAALAPAHDDRVAALKHAHPALASFLNRFEDNFGEKFEPAVLLARPSISRNIEALAHFRDLIALSAVTRGRALEIQCRRGHRVVFGESFAIYPWMLDRHYKDIVGSTSAILGTHELARFKGQSSPAIFRTPLDEYDIDQPLLDALMARWRRRYEDAKPTPDDIALMRSLNMAYHASLLPSGTETMFYDTGRIVCLWVSAFEILAHPGESGEVNLSKVFDLIERTQWAKNCSQKTYEIDYKKKPNEQRVLASWLYHKLYKCRNDFIHGNPVDSSNLDLPSGKRTIFEYAAPLYRIALTAFLPIEHGQIIESAEDEEPWTDNPEALGKQIADSMELMGPQETVEEALLTACQTPATPT